MKRHSHGFTVIELMVVIALLIGATVLFFYQKNDLVIINKDERRKVAINAIYYNLEEVFYPKNGYYPAELTPDNLNAMDPDLLIDTNGVKINDQIDTSEMDDVTKKSLEGQDLHLSEYRYQGTDCSLDGKCKGYRLHVDLQKEAQFVKENRRR